MTKILDPRKSFEQFRRNEKKPLTCTYCFKQFDFYIYKEWQNSLTNSAPFCRKCAKFYDSTMEKGNG